MEINNPLFIRLQEYRVDFAYTSGDFFAAASRLKKSFIRKEKVYKTLNIVAAGLGISSLTVLQLLLANVTGRIPAVLIASVTSFAGVIISLRLFFHKNPEKYVAYHNRAEEYLILYKQVKDNEVRFLKGKLSDSQLSDELARINAVQERINKIPLTDLTEEDYNKASSDIKKGSRTYSETDFKNT
ncbi:MAG TPA: hypothetical protein PKA77_16290 [Chitinophagaceae bacterium]|jgi:hypothetical protein|nr:hypothetical protein [Chitinophagaceae bacterium]HMU59585.1 hypothetical protein [Chitinophagaceae bacterium]